MLPLPITDNESIVRHNNDVVLKSNIDENLNIVLNSIINVENKAVP